MRHIVKLPRLGDTTQSAVVLEWLMQVGDEVKEGDALFTVETEKVETDVPSPVSGLLVERLVDEGDEVPTGAPIAVLKSQT